MKKIIAVSAFASLLLAACRPDHPHPKEQQIHIKFTDIEGVPIKESSSGQTVVITSTQFANLNPNGLSPDRAKLFVENIQVPFEVAGPNAISLQLPVMYLHDYKRIEFTIRYNQSIIRFIERLLYRPTVTGAVLAGNDGTFQMPAEMTIDASGNLYVIDQRTDHDVIIKVTPAGVSSIFAGAANEFGRLVGIGIDLTTLRIYVADATAQQVKGFNLSSPSTVFVKAGSGTAGNADGAGTVASFRFGTARVDNFGTNERGQGLHVDALGNIFVGEQFGTAFSGGESQIRKISPAGLVSTVAGSRITMPSGPEVLHPVAGVTLHPATGEVAYIGGASSFFQGIARITTTGTMVRIAGKVSNENLVDGPGSIAEFAFPKAISYNDGYYHVADGTNGAYRRVTPAGNVITLAGVGHFSTPSFCGCGITGPRDSSYVMPSIFTTGADRYALAAKAIIMDQVGGIAVKNNGLLYVSDYGTNFKCIWRIRIE